MKIISSNARELCIFYEDFTGQSNNICFIRWNNSLTNNIYVKTFDDYCMKEKHQLDYWTQCTLEGHYLDYPAMVDGKINFRIEIDQLHSSELHETISEIVETYNLQYIIYSQ